MKLEASKVSLKTDPDDESINIPSNTTSTLPNTLCIPAMFTATTATITPTTLRNIEQAFLEINNTENESMPFQAGFVPPPATAASYHSSISADGVGGSDNEFSMDSSSMMSNSSDNGMSPVPPVVVENAKEEGQGKKVTKTASRKNKGGRRPNKASNLSPEEEEKRRVRRERNKMAAARCRRRREDRTKELLTETGILESKKRALQTEVEELEREKQDLEFLLESHKSSCKRLARQENSLLHIKPDPEIVNTLLSLADRIKAEPVEIVNNPVEETVNESDDHQEENMSDSNDDEDSDRTQSPKRKILLTSAVIDPLPTITKQDTMISVNVPKINRPNRPNTLNVPLLGGNSTSQALNSIPIQTPSNGIFNFESLMEGGTGLTPVQPKIMGESSKTPLELITPTSEGSKLI